MKDMLLYIGWVIGTLLPIINPVSAAGLLLAISGHLSATERNRQIFRACLYMSAILLGFLWGGVLIMDLFGISLPGLRIAGGMIVAFLGFRLLFPHAPAFDVEREAADEARIKDDISFTPLAMPGLSGPGSIALVISMSSSLHDAKGLSAVSAYIAMSLGILVSAVIIWVCLRAAGYVKKFLGANGIDAFSRIMGFLMVSIGVQFAIDGVRDLLHDPAFWPG